MLLSNCVIIIVFAAITAPCLAQPAHFYPFGTEVGDAIAPVNDDGYTERTEISTGFPFFNQTYASLYVNTNGMISFTQGVGTFTPSPFPLDNDYVIVAPFWADVDTTENDGRVYYRETTARTVLERATADIIATFGAGGLYSFSATWVFIATWHKVTYYGGSRTTPVNSFQAVLITDGTYSFTVFNYGDITWTYGSASDGIDAQVGFNAGDGENYFAVPSSRTPDVADIEITTNVGLLGRWVFRIDGAKIEDTTCELKDEWGCDLHQEYDANTGTCKAIAPVIPACPQLQGPTIVSRQAFTTTFDYVYFYCVVTDGSTAVQPNAIYEITWLFDGEPDYDNLPPKRLSGAKGPVSAELPDWYLRGHFNQWVSCSVKSYYGNSINIAYSRSVTSDGYWIGLRVSEDSLNIYEDSDEPATVLLKSTLPVICRYGQCSPRFDIMGPPDVMVAQQRRTTDGHQCTYSFEEDDWKENEKFAYDIDYPLEAKASPDPFITSTRFYTMQLRATDPVPKPMFHDDGRTGETYWLWNDVIYSLPIYRHDSPNSRGGSCTANGDPRITTMDRTFYSIYHHGQFRMVQTTGRRLFQVDVRFWNCSRVTGSCVCGVAVREGNTVLALQICDPTSPGVSIINNSPAAILPPGAEVITDKNGYIYTINMPSGASVTAHVYSWGMNINVHVLSSDARKTEGLCGNFDGDNSNDLQHQGDSEVASITDQEEVNAFVETWRVPRFQSLFETAELVDLTGGEVTEAFCRCGVDNTGNAGVTQHQLCGAEHINYGPNDVRFPVIPSFPINLILRLHRGKRAVYSPDGNELYEIDNEYDPFKFDYGDGGTAITPVPAWPVNSITETMAREHCTEGIVGSAAYLACTGFVNEMDPLINKCMLDVQTTGELGWASDKVAELRDDCVTNLFNSANVTASNRSQAMEEVYDKIKDTAQALVESVCPNDCSSRGACEKGQCLCADNYIGSACEAEAGTPPTIMRLKNTAVCDMRSRQCLTPRLVVSNIDANNVLCLIQANNTGVTEDSPATIISAVEVSCLLPASLALEAQESVTIMLTNDGKQLSNSITYTLYDSACYTCWDMDNCTRVESSCIIYGACYREGDVNPGNPCQLCDPAQSNSLWTPSQENAPPVYESSNNFVKVAEEYLELQLTASDSDGHLLTFSLVAGDIPTLKITPTGTLTYSGSSNISTTITITDSCGETSNTSIHIAIIPCSCESFEVCQPNATESRGKGAYVCACPQGFGCDDCSCDFDDCAIEPCVNGACVDGVDEYMCTCADRYCGKKCDHECICLSSPCANGSCVEHESGFTCTCNAGYTGILCDSELPPHICESVPCSNGSCIEEGDGFSCVCYPGYSGYTCNLNIDECESNPCLYGQCLDMVNEFKCICDDLYTGLLCDAVIGTCMANSCIHGSCSNTTNGHVCFCDIGYTGAKCDEELNECISSPCDHGVCMDAFNSYTCQCEEGYTGRHCDMAIGHCKDNPCDHGRCYDTGTAFFCDCLPGYTGDICDENIDECASSPCISGICTDFVDGFSCTCDATHTGDRCEVTLGSCASDSCVEGICESTPPEGFRCICHQGWTGPQCELPINECLSYPCEHGSCDDQINGYSCTCEVGFVGVTCSIQINDACASSPCVNGATCVDGIASYTCQCDSIHTGQMCENRIQFCATGPCTHGTCQETTDGFDCICENGYGGSLCEINIDECASNPCIHGSCTDLVASYTCSCNDGYSGSDCDSLILDCSSIQCINGVCTTDTNNNPTCICNAGYTGLRCESEINECISNPCTFGTCTDKVNYYECFCLIGYTGARCDLDINECTGNPCQHAAVCINLPGSFRCECESGYEGTLCDINTDDCINNPCRFGDCVDMVDDFECQCTSGYGGILCDQPIDECGSSPCIHGNCIDLLASYKCICDPGYTGTHCEWNINECLSNPCMYGTCMDHVNKFVCDCNVGFRGTFCDEEIDECESAPCLNDAQCVDGTNRYQCICIAGFTGIHCETNINECSSSPCINNGICKDNVNKFICECPKGFSGALCDINIDECLSGPCVHGNCTDLVNEYSCVCDRGYMGVTCNTRLDPCGSAYCGHGECVDQLDQYLCKCKPGYTGESCEVDIDDCATAPCSGHGECVDQVNAFRCECQPGYSGELCDSDIDECVSSPCGVNGVCHDLVDDFSCSCVTGYTGEMCETDIDDCASSPCQHGTCNDLVGLYTCSCMHGYTGSVCDAVLNLCASQPCGHGTCLQQEPGVMQCLCEPGYTSAMCNDEIDECASSPCVEGACEDLTNGYTCTCTSGFTGTNCDSKIPGWAWSSWGRCDKDCGFGLQNRSRVCQNDAVDCEVIVEFQECNTFKCFATTEYIPHINSSVIQFAQADELEVSNNEDKIQEDLAYVMNLYCLSNSDVCCGLVNKINSGFSSVFTKTHVFIRSLWTEDGSTNVEIFVRLPSSELENNCMANRKKRQANDGSPLQLPKQVVNGAIEENAEVLSERLGMPINLLIEDPTNLLPVIVTVPVVAFVIIVLICSGFFIWRSKQKEHQSFARVEKKPVYYEEWQQGNENYIVVPKPDYEEEKVDQYTAPGELPRPRGLHYIPSAPSGQVRWTTGSVDSLRGLGLSDPSINRYDYYRERRHEDFY